MHGLLPGADESAPSVDGCQSRRKGGSGYARVLVGRVGGSVE